MSSSAARLYITAAEFEAERKAAERAFQHKCESEEKDRWEASYAEYLDAAIWVLERKGDRWVPSYAKCPDVAEWVLEPKGEQERAEEYLVAVALALRQCESETQDRMAASYAKYLAAAKQQINSCLRNSLTRARLRIARRDR